MRSDGDVYKIETTGLKEPPLLRQIRKLALGAVTRPTPRTAGLNHDFHG